MTTRLALTYAGLFILGAIVSYLGNQLGRKIGRQKMSVFNLRPRHTSILITSLTGSLIAMMTLTFAYVSSWEVRTFFTTGLQQYGNRISEVTAKTIEQAKNGGIIYRPGEPILTAIIDGTKSSDEIKAQIERTMAYVNSEAIERNRSVAEVMDTTFTPPEDGKIAGYYKNDMEELTETISKLKGKMILEPKAENYVLLGEKFSVRFSIKEYIPRVFDKDDEIISGVIDGSMSGEAIATDLSKLIIRAKMTAIGKGMLENPMTRQLIEIDRSELLRSAQEISDKRGPCTVTVRAARETDNRGPLEIFIDVR